MSPALRDMLRYGVALAVGIAIFAGLVFGVGGIIGIYPAEAAGFVIAAFATWLVLDRTRG